MRANRVYLHVKRRWGCKQIVNNESARLVTSWAQRGRARIIQFKVSAMRLATVLGLAVFVVNLHFAHAAGVGAADVESVLGQKLSVRIPIFNVDDPDRLGLSVQSDMFAGNPAKRLKVELQRGNNQLAARVFSDWEVMEPYVEFSLELRDGDMQQNKDFIVLLDFNPLATSVDPLRLPEQRPATDVPRNPVVTIERLRPVASANAGQQAPQSSDTMGPYDWAEAGNIPARFGAVLDGQSLWRVARRINQAMGVSVEQMMVALYEANRSAFLTSSIDSLKAGSFLTIPDQSTVSSLSRSAAEIRVSELSGEQFSRPITSTEVVSEQLTVETVEDTDTPELVDTPPEEQLGSTGDAAAAANEPLFVIGEGDVLSDLDLMPIDAVQADSGEAVSVPPLNTDAVTTGQVADQQGIINSLSKTIGDLMRDNVEKEQRLQILDERLEALESVMDNLNLAAASELAITAPQTAPEESGFSWWLWLVPMTLAGAGWFGYRYHLESKAASQDLFVDSPATAAPIDDDELDEFDDQPVSKFKEFPTNTDFSPMRSHKSRYPQEDDDLEGVSYQELDDSFREPEMNADSMMSENTIEFDTSNIATFPTGARRDLLEAVEEFIAERDFAAACGALEKARGNELDEPNYHFQMLRILLERNDEHGFYEYFNTVENKFVDVDRELKLDLANLVSRLNQQG